MRILFILLFCAFSFSFYGQEKDYLAKMYNSYHAISQKEGTTELLKEYLAPYRDIKKEVYAILFAPQACPRCEVDINYLLDNVQKMKPNATVILIASYPNSKGAQEYLERFHTKNIIIDTENKHEKIFHYRAGRLAVTFFLQIDMEQGRLMCGGDSPDINEDFIQQFCNNTAYMPYAPKENQVVPTSVAAHNKWNPQGTYKSIFVQVGEDKTISELFEMPQWQGDAFLYSDELASEGRLFFIKKDTAYLEKAIVPTKAQETASVQLPDSTYQKMKKEGYIYIMANTCAFVPGTQRAIVSYSLPDMFEKEGGNIAYYNRAAFLSTNRDDSVCNMVSFDFEKKALPLYMYVHTTPFCPIDERYVLIGCRRGYPTGVTSEQLLKDSTSVDNNIFLPDFYDYSPFCAIFDMQTGKRVRRFGQLDEVYKRAQLGYYFTIPVADVYKDILAYSDGFSGKLWITNKNSDETGREVKLFDVVLNDLPQRQLLRYTDEYFEPFFTDLNQQVEKISLDSNGIHCLIRQGTNAMKDKSDRYEYRLLNYSGELQQKQFLVLEEGDEVLSVGLGKDKEQKVFPFYFCKNSKGSYLKSIVL